MVETLQSYVPAIVLGALSQTRERRGYAEEVIIGLDKIRKMAIRTFKDRIIISWMRRDGYSSRRGGSEVSSRRMEIVG